MHSDFPPLPERTLGVGVAVSSDRSRTSRSSALDTRRPARHCSSINSFAFGFGAALMMAFTSSASKYSGMRFWLWELRRPVFLDSVRRACASGRLRSKIQRSYGSLFFCAAVMLCVPR